MDALIEARNLEKRFGAVMAADRISVAIKPGETVGIIGANGAGKTTFVNMVTGYLKPESGTILFRGRDITGLRPRQVTRMGIRRSFQVAQLFPNLSVLDNVLAAIASAEAASLPMFRPLRTPARIEAALSFLRRIGLEDRAGGLTTELAQGQRKLLDIGLAMAGRSEVLLLDEPTSGISAEEKFPMMDLIMEAVGGEGATVLFVEHDMEIVERYAARVLAFYEGRIIADGPPRRVLSNADVRRYVVGTELHRRPAAASI
jgi:branched-chain amino acid transport system ATP-binding protein